MVDVKVTNPITYFNNWWKKIIGNEGIEVKASSKIKPLTAFFLLGLVVSGGITIGLLNKVKNSALVVGQFIPAIGSNNLVEGGFVGTLTKTLNGVYYLVTNLEAVSLSVPANLPIDVLEGKKVLATGKYNSDTKILYVDGVKAVSE